MKQSLSPEGFRWIAAAVVSALLPVLPGFPAWFAIALLAAAALGIGLGLRQMKLPAWLRLMLTLLLAGAAAASAAFTASQAAGAALLAAMLALKLLETHTLRDGRSACSFALFAIIAGFLQDQGPQTLLLAVFAAIIVIVALGWLAQHEFPEQPTDEKIPALRRVRHGAALMALSLPFAMIAFFLFPRFPNPLWGAPNAASEARTGLSNELSPGDIVELLIDDSPALRVSFQGDAPPKQAMYWRGPVMGRFDGRKWSSWDGDMATPAAPLSNPEATFAYEVMQEPASHNFLLAMDIAIAPPERSRAGYGRTLYARASNSVRRFHAESATRYVLEPAISNDMRRRHTALPPEANPRAAQMVAQWQSGNPDPQALIQRALALFNAEFTYTLSPPELAGRNSVDDFLFNTKAGFCEHFASAFAVLMRHADIPARVITGYQGGELNTLGNYWLVRQSDAHAWTEVWLQGKGWMRVDPTAAVAPERIERGRGDLGPEPSALARFGRPLLQALDVLRRGWNDFVLDFNVQRQRDLLRRLGLDWSDWRHIGAALGIGIALALALTFVLLMRGVSIIRQTPLEAAWSRFLAVLARRGMHKQPAETATDFARRLDASLTPADADAATALIDRYVMHAYAPQHDAAASEHELIQALRRFRLAHKTPPSTRTSPP